MTARALVVDDDPVSRRVLMLMLGAAGQRVVCASGGAEALSIMEVYQPTLACVDLHMPGLSGLELVDAMRERLGPSMPPVVMLTASGDPSDMSRAEAAGVDCYVTKPIGSRDIAMILESVSKTKTNR